MNLRNKKQFQLAISVALAIIVVGLLGYLSVRFKVQADWTYGGRNTLTAGSQKLLGDLKGPVRFLVFDYPTSSTRPAVEMWIDRYRRFKPDVASEFIDPSRELLKAKQYAINQPGEVVVEYQNRHETLSTLSEPIITGALQRLTDAGERYVVFLEGHGERATVATPGAEPSQNDYTNFAQALRDKGLKVQPINLVKTPKIPDNTAALVIASPAKALLEGEVKLVDDYVKAGGSLLWLADPDQPPGLDTLAKTLGVSWLKGFAVFPDYQALGTGSPGTYLATEYPPNPVTQGFAEITAFPLVRALNTAGAKAAGYTAAPLLETSKRSWLETGAMEGEIAFDEKTDLPGPLTIGATLTRELKADPAAAGKAPGEDKKDGPRTQRIALVGDADFLADANLAVGGNKQLGLNLVQWLTLRDAQLNIDVPKAPDTALNLPPWTLWLIGLGYTIVLPLLLLGFGIGRWIVRRRA